MKSIFNDLDILIILYTRNYLYNIFLVLPYTTTTLTTVLTTDLVYKTK